MRSLLLFSYQNGVRLFQLGGGGREVGLFKLLFAESRVLNISVVFVFNHIIRASRERSTGFQSVFNFVSLTNFNVNFLSIELESLISLPGSDQPAPSTSSSTSTAMDINANGGRKGEVEGEGLIIQGSFFGRIRGKQLF